MGKSIQYMLTQEETVLLLMLWLPKPVCSTITVQIWNKDSHIFQIKLTSGWSGYPKPQYQSVYQLFQHFLPSIYTAADGN